MSMLTKSAQLASRLARIALFNPSRLRHVLGSALVISNDVVDRTRDLLRIPSVTVDDLLPKDTPLDTRFIAFPKSYASVSVLEYICLVLLVKQTRQRSIFEFGTYKGVSISQLALNLPAEARIYTLDLPDNENESCIASLDIEDALIAAEKNKGDMVPQELRHRIIFLKQNSAKFNEQKFEGQMDFVFVDGAHDAHFVRNDSEKGWRMLASKGIIVWHDCCTQDPAVVRYLIESLYQPRRIDLTSLAFAVKP